VGPGGKGKGKRGEERVLETAKFQGEVRMMEKVLTILMNGLSPRPIGKYRTF
jgi:hypothetical protein